MIWDRFRDRSTHPRNIGRASNAEGMWSGFINMMPNYSSIGSKFPNDFWFFPTPRSVHAQIDKVDIIISSPFVERGNSSGSTEDHAYPRLIHPFRDP